MSDLVAAGFEPAAADRAPVRSICRLVAGGIELSMGWDLLQRGEVPEEVEAFFVLWQDRASGDFVAEGFYLSTSEPSPHMGCDAFVVYSVSISICPRTRAECLRRAASVDLVELSKPFVYDGRFRQIFDKFVADKKKRGAAGRGPVAKPEVLSDCDYENLKREFAAKTKRT